MSNETEQPKIQADESQKIEQVKTLPKPGEESVQTETLPQPEEEPAQVDGEVVDDQSSKEGESQTTEPDAKAEGSQPNPRLPPTPMIPVKKAVLWMIVFLLAMVIFYHFGYLRGRSEEQMKNISHVPEKEVVLQTDLKAIEEAVTKQRVASEEQFHAFVNRLEKQLNQFKSELEYRQLWERFASGEDAGRCTKGVYSGQVSCTNGLRADLNEYLTRLEARNVCASGEWTAVQSDSPTESAASEASAVQPPPNVEYKDGLVFKFCQRPEFESPDS